MSVHMARSKMRADTKSQRDKAKAEKAKEEKAAKEATEAKAKPVAPVAGVTQGVVAGTPKTSVPTNAPSGAQLKNLGPISVAPKPLGEGQGQGQGPGTKLNTGPGTKLTTDQGQGTKLTETGQKLPESGQGQTPKPKGVDIGTGTDPKAKKKTESSTEAESGQKSKADQEAVEKEKKAKVQTQLEATTPELNFVKGQTKPAIVTESTTNTVAGVIHKKAVTEEAKLSKTTQKKLGEINLEIKKTRTNENLSKTEQDAKIAALDAEKKKAKEDNKKQKNESKKAADIAVKRKGITKAEKAVKDAGKAVGSLEQRIKEIGTTTDPEKLKDLETLKSEKVTADATLAATEAKLKNTQAKLSANNMANINKLGMAKKTKKNSKAKAKAAKLADEEANLGDVITNKLGAAKNKAKGPGGTGGQGSSSGQGPGGTGSPGGQDLGGQYPKGQGPGGPGQGGQDPGGQYPKGQGPGGPGEQPNLGAILTQVIKSVAGVKEAEEKSPAEKNIDLKYSEYHKKKVAHIQKLAAKYDKYQRSGKKRGIFARFFSRPLDKQIKRARTQMAIEEYKYHSSIRKLKKETKRNDRVKEILADKRAEQITLSERISARIGEMLSAAKFDKSKASANDLKAIKKQFKAEAKKDIQKELNDYEKTVKETSKASGILADEIRRKKKMGLEE